MVARSYSDTPQRFLLLEERIQMTLEEWLEEWSALVEAGQSTITRDEAIRRYHKMRREVERG